VRGLQQLVAEADPVEFRRALAAVLQFPSVLNACFCLDNLILSRLNTCGFCLALDTAWARLHTECAQAEEEAERQWLQAVSAGLDSLILGGTGAQKLWHRDQVRCLAIYLLLPIWQSKLPRAQEVLAKVAETCAHLSATGRRTLCELLADECGDAVIMRDRLVQPVRAYANCAVEDVIDRLQKAGPETHIGQILTGTFWGAILLLQILYSANKQAEAAARAAIAGSETPGSAARARLPENLFQISSLVDASYPPELELRCFCENAQLHVPGPDVVVLSSWEEPGGSEPWSSGAGLIPRRFQSLLAHANLVPVAFKQKVLRAENAIAQHRNQQQALAGALFQGIAGGLLNGGPLILDMQSLVFQLKVRRSHVVQDTFDILKDRAPSDLRRPLRVHFSGEEGVDEGGVTREYFGLLSRELFSADFGMFKECSETRRVWFQTASTRPPQDFWATGTLVGLAVYNNCPGLDVPFPSVLFKKLKGLSERSMQDLAQVSPSHARSLQMLQAWAPAADLSPKGKDADKAFQDTFCLDFSMSFEGPTGTKIVRLDEDVEDGSEAPPVTLARRTYFGDRLTKWILDESVRPQFDAFRRGFMHICDSPVIQNLSPVELEAIICGGHDLDFEHLKAGSQYEGFSATDPYIERFWELACSLDTAQKRQFLHFTTGSELAPLAGLQQLGLKIQRNGSEPCDRLPTAHTCFNLLLLPEYESLEKLQRLLLTAIENAEGFGLE